MNVKASNTKVMIIGKYDKDVSIMIIKEKVEQVNVLYKYLAVNARKNKEIVEL